MIDKVLDYRVDEVGDIPVQIHIFPDAGGADVLQVGGELQLDDLAGDGIVQLGHRLPRAAEDDVVHLMDGEGAGLGTVGGGVGHHIAAGHDIDLLPGEQLHQPL